MNKPIVEEEEEEEEEDEEDEDEDDEDEDDDDDEDVRWPRYAGDIDDGDGGKFTLPKGSELAKALARGKSAHGQSDTAAPGNKDQRAVKRLVMDAADMDDIWKELAPRKKKRRARKSRARKRIHGRGAMPSEIADLLGEANTLFAFTDLSAAREKLLEVIRLWPSSPDAYHTLGLIHEEEGEAGRALECFIIAAHLTGKDESLWRRLAEMSRDQKNYHQAIYCLNRALRLRMEPEYLWEKSSLLTTIGQPRKAIDCLILLLKKLPEAEKEQRFNACKELARLHHQARPSPLPFPAPGRARPALCRLPRARGSGAEAA